MAGRLGIKNIGVLFTVLLGASDIESMRSDTGQDWQIGIAHGRKQTPWRTIGVSLNSLVKIGGFSIRNQDGIVGCRVAKRILNNDIADGKHRVTNVIINQSSIHGDVPLNTGIACIAKLRSGIGQHRC